MSSNGIHCTVTSLLSGSNATGSSVLVSFDRSVGHDNESHPISRCLVNVGDGTQRFCSERRIKLSTVSCIIVTSLAPHNLSGFSGVFLSLSDLGVGKLTVIGPAGIQSSLDLMLPFINRKYPVIDVVEVDPYTSAEDLSVETDHLVINIKPVFVNESKTKVIAVAADIVERSSWHSSTVNSLSSSAFVCSVIPHAHYFESTPSVVELVEHSVTVRKNRFGSESQQVTLFCPLGVASFDEDYSTEDNDNDYTESNTFSRLQSLCKRHHVQGFYGTGNLTTSQIECGHAQGMLAILRRLCSPLFPDVPPSLRSMIHEAQSQTKTTSSGSRELSCSKTDICSDLAVITPMLSITQVDEKDKKGEYNGSSFTVSNSLSSAARRCVDKLQLYENTVLPQLTELLETGSGTSHSVHPPVPGLPPTPTQFGTLTPILVPRSGYEVSELDSSGRRRPHSLSCSDARDLNHHNYYNMLPPSGPPTWATSPSSLPSPFSTAEESSTPSSLYILTDTSSLYDSRERSLGSTSSFPSVDEAEVASPSPSNYTAASLLRANLLQKRKHPRSLNILGSHIEEGHSQSGEELPGGDSRQLMLNTLEDEDTVRDSPLKSLRLNDSSKQFTFPDQASADEVVAAESAGIAEVGEDGGASSCPSIVADNNCTAPTAAVISEEARAAYLAFEKSIFRVPPPNPFADICTVTFLGTGSAKPSKYRNGSCIMLTLNNHRDNLGQSPSSSFKPLSVEIDSSEAEQPRPCKQIVLLDVGESTAAQMFQSVSGDIARYDELLLGIKMIWISHHHADHITGVPMLLEQIKRARMRQEKINTDEEDGEDPLRVSLRKVPASVSKYDLRSMYAAGDYEPGKVMIIGSEAVLKYFEFSACVAGLDDFVTFCPVVKTLYAGATTEIAAATEGVITRLRSIPVQHCQSSYGVVLDFNTTHKIVYSGDCRPSQSLVRAGLDCDLLIHEATFDDTRQEDAAKKRHSTSSEARRVASQMRAKHTVLTHFSQRYPLEMSKAKALNSAAISTTPKFPGFTHSVSTSALDETRNNKNQFHNQRTPINNNHSSNGHSSSGSSTRTAAVAYDFLRFSFPSQIADLPRVTSAIGTALTALETERKKAETSSHGMVVPVL